MTSAASRPRLILWGRPSDNSRPDYLNKDPQLTVTVRVALYSIFKSKGTNGPDPVAVICRHIIVAGTGSLIGRSIVVGVTGFKLTISMCSLIR